MSREYLKRPFPSCLLPLCQNESKCETIHMKMSSAYRFIFIQIKVVSSKNGFALSLVLKQRHKETGNGLFKGRPSIRNSTLILTSHDCMFQIQDGCCKVERSRCILLFMLLSSNLKRGPRVRGPNSVTPIFWFGMLRFIATTEDFQEFNKP